MPRIDRMFCCVSLFVQVNVVLGMTSVEVYIEKDEENVIVFRLLFSLLLFVGLVG